MNRNAFYGVAEGRIKKFQGFDMVAFAIAYVGECGVCPCTVGIDIGRVGYYSVETVLCADHISLMVQHIPIGVVKIAVVGEPFCVVYILCFADVFECKTVVVSSR